MGVIDGNTVNGDVIGAGPVANFSVQPQVVSDANRRSLVPKEWMAEFFKSTSLPAGHGFSQANIDNNSAAYTFEPKSDLPLKMIVLDDAQDPNNFDIKEQGYLDEKRFNWLVNELDKGQAEGKLMIVSAHVPATLVAYAKHSPVSAKTLIAKLNTYSNLVLWLSGHVHRNTITPLKSPDINHPELGFWQVETASIRNFPQQFRTIQIVKNTDNTLSIFATDVDIAAKEGSFAAKSQIEGLGANEIFGEKIVLPPSGAYDAELVKQLSPEMQAKIANIGTPLKN